MLRFDSCIEEMLISTNSKDLSEEVVKSLSSNFAVKDLGSVSNYLEIT